MSTPPARSRQRDISEAVAADLAHHRNLAAGPRGRQRLVGALAARHHLVARTQHGLARLRQMRDGHGQIDIERAENDDHYGFLLVPPAQHEIRATLPTWHSAFDATGRRRLARQCLTIIAGFDHPVD
jgi:hypothetical protein